MTRPIARIFSDLHYGDRASKLTRLDALAPLLDGADRIILNGDTIDTRPSRDPAATAALRAEVAGFFGRLTTPVTFIPGNHDPDISPLHSIEFAAGRVFVTHGDILFASLVPWGRDAAAARAKVAAELAALPPHSRELLDARLAAAHRAAATIPQRHQAERHGLKYFLGFIGDTIWPPWRMFFILRAWRETPARAARLVRRFRLPAKFFVMGHTHRFGVTRTLGGLVVVNTGSFTPPGPAGFVDLTPDRLIVRRIVARHGEFHPGPILAEFALAGR
ncbi:MAG TPA: metallophosphoesterase family protein [Opitutus sp.]|nr:metallophosphoesterase family protein [Opitutus sp.]